MVHKNSVGMRLSTIFSTQETNWSTENFDEKTLLTIEDLTQKVIPCSKLTIEKNH